MEIVVGTGGQKENKEKEWEWNPKDAAYYQYHWDRFTLLRPVSYEATARVTQEGDAALLPGRTGTALSINVSNGGMCLLIETELTVREVLRVHIPMPGTPATTPSLAEVRWVRPLPFTFGGMYVAGLRFLI